MLGASTSLYILIFDYCQSGPFNIFPFIATNVVPWRQHLSLCGIKLSKYWIVNFFKSWSCDFYITRISLHPDRVEMHSSHQFGNICFCFFIFISIYICICISICILVCNCICICTELHSSYQFGNITTQLKPVWDNMWVARMPFSSSAAKNGSIGFFLGQKWADCGIVAKQCRLDLELEWSPNWGGPEKLTKYRCIYRYEYKYK